MPPFWALRTTGQTKPPKRPKTRSNHCWSRSRGQQYVEIALSKEVFTSLHSRFTEPGYTGLAAWDPCGVVQAATIALGLSSICYVGLSSMTTVDSNTVPDMPILGSRIQPVTSALKIVVFDHNGNVRPTKSRQRRSNADRPR